MAYDPAITRLALLSAFVALICTIYGLYRGNATDVLGGIAFALLANFLKWDDPDM